MSKVRKITISIIGSLVGIFVILCIIGLSYNAYQDKQNGTPSTPTPSSSSSNDNTTSSSSDKQAANYYISQIKGAYSNLINEVGHIQTLAAEDASDNQLIFNQSYRDDIQSTCTDMEQDISTIQSVNLPDGNQTVQDLNTTIQQGIADLKFVADNLPSDVDNVNAEGVQADVDHLKDADQYWEQATSQMTSIQQGN